MPGSLQNKLQLFEVAPPQGVWDKISRRLDEEFAPSDSEVSATLEDASIPPPAGVWNKISTALDDEALMAERPRRVVPLFVRTAVAAAVIGIFILAGLYFLNTNKPGENIARTVPGKTTRPAHVTKEQQPKTTGNDSKTLITNSELLIPAFKKLNSRPIPRPRVVTTVDDAPVPPVDYPPKPEQAPLYDLQTVSALQPVSVNAPPLRDKKGNIILDASLISSPDDEYITVTGPNGKQTRISSKFLSCLGYINASLNSNDADLRGIQCKTQFEEWRKKIIAQPAFIPTANNFFDIFELKDLLQEM